MRDYVLISDVTADVSPDLMRDAPEVAFLPMPVRIAEKDYLYGAADGITAEEFYLLQRKGCFASTAQITPEAYARAFEPYLAAGKDILYLCFTSGMSGSWQSSQIAAKGLLKRYPWRRIVCLDTLCASVGEGFLVREAAMKKAEGLDLEALEAWVTSHRLDVCHWFTVDGFAHLRHGGRVSPTASAIGSVLNIKPLLHVDEVGKLAVVEKPRGQKSAMNAQLKRMREGWEPSLGKLVLIGHGDCPDRAQELAERVASEYPEADIRVSTIGPVIGSHTGPGMLALIYWGRNR